MALNLSWQYIAGFFDGEGCARINMGGGPISLHISICQSDARGYTILEEIKTFLASYDVFCGPTYQTGTQPNTKKKMWRLYIYTVESGVRFIRGVLPYLHVKKTECQDLMRFLQVYPPFYAWVSKLKEKAMCEICGKPRKVLRSRTCGVLSCRGQLIWKVRHGLAPKAPTLTLGFLQKVKETH